jgi:hypothetical protein
MPKEARMRKTKKNPSKAQIIRQLKSKVRLYEDFIATVISLDRKDVEQYVSTGNADSQSEPIVMKKK